MFLRRKITLGVLVLIITAGSGFAALKLLDFTQNNPRFCISCHLMRSAFETWEKSKHQNINCHDCHHLSIPEKNRLLINFILKKPKKVPERHGKIIVPWQYCIKCHWETDARYPKAVKINKSTLHAKHVFMEQTECSKCHGYIVHKFLPEERFCVKCHQDKVIHGVGMEGLACLNCHTDIGGKDLKPKREKCLFCHGSEDDRRKLITEKTIDVKFFQPSPEVINKAIKINVPPDAPMQLYCYTCHKPHAKVRPDWGDCLNCHKNIRDVGKHNIHIEIAAMQCKECHKPHLWRVTVKSAKKDCIGCHEYKEPKKFIGS